jgi:hypothetical protein
MIKSLVTPMDIAFLKDACKLGLGQCLKIKDITLLLDDAMECAERRLNKREEVLKFAENTVFPDNGRTIWNLKIHNKAEYMTIMEERTSWM